MARRKKFTALEEEVFQIWDSVVFPNGRWKHSSGGPEDAIEYEKNLRPVWEGLLTKAHDGETWLVGGEVASTVSRSIWWNAMAVGDYGRAADAIRLLLKNEAFSDRSASLEHLIRLHVTTLLDKGDGRGADELKELIGSGLSKPSRIANQVFYALICWTDRLKAEEKVPDEIRSLVRCIAIARKCSKKLVASLDRLSTWAELDGALHSIFGNRLKKADANLQDC